MINTIRITILIFFIMLSGCEYKPILSSNNSNFAIAEIKFVGEKKIATKINNSLKIYNNTKDKNKFYNLEIYANKEKNIITRDAKGNPKIFEIKILIDLVVLENNEIKNKKKIVKNFTYNNNSNKFDLKQYEKNIENNLMDEIISEIILHLHSM